VITGLLTYYDVFLFGVWVCVFGVCVGAYRFVISNPEFFNKNDASSSILLVAFLICVFVGAYAIDAALSHLRADVKNKSGFILQPQLPLR
jgi:hypothetical protein